jgi:hypothetical protein
MRPVALLTDFGLADHYVGVLHAVLERDAPGVARIDLGHDVPAGDVWAASFLLRCAWPHLPRHAVVLAVVDPAVGTPRRAVAARIGERALVAPDNGLATAIGPVDEAVELRHEVMGVAQPSATFHGRDLFAPAAGRLATGCELPTLGPEVPRDSLARCPLPEPTAHPDGVEATILWTDRFGNLVTNTAEHVRAGVTGARLEGRAVRRVRTYAEADPEEAVLLVGSAGLFELAVNRGSAADALGLERGDTVTLVTRSDR